MHNFCASALLDEYGVRLNVLGRKELLPEGVQRAVEKAEKLTRHNDRYVYSSDNFLSLSLSPTWVYQSYWNLFQLPPPPLVPYLIFVCHIRRVTRSRLRSSRPYGRRWTPTVPQICALAGMLEDTLVELIIARSEITEKTIEDNLFTSLGGSPPVDILVRTSGAKRLSDFLLWQVRRRFLFLIIIRFSTSNRRCV